MLRLEDKSLAREVTNLELLGSQPHLCVWGKSKEQIGGLRGQLPLPWLRACSNSVSLQALLNSVDEYICIDHSFIFLTKLTMAWEKPRVLRNSSPSLLPILLVYDIGQVG